jgi:hypothetical protein
MGAEVRPAAMAESTTVDPAMENMVAGTSTVVRTRSTAGVAAGPTGNMTAPRSSMVVGKKARDPIVTHRAVTAALPRIVPMGALIETMDRIIRVVVAHRDLKDMRIMVVKNGGRTNNTGQIQIPHTGLLTPTVSHIMGTNLQKQAQMPHGERKNSLTRRFRN